MPIETQKLSSDADRELTESLLLYFDFEYPNVIAGSPCITLSIYNKIIEFI
jgi:hypothetical protein